MTAVYHVYLSFKHWLLYGDVYQFTSGPIIAGGLVTLTIKHNCYEHGCWRIGRVRSQLDNHTRCKKHHAEHRNHPAYVDAKELT